MKGIMELDKREDCILYRAACACLNQPCDTTIEIEKDEDGIIWMNFYKNIIARSYCDNWITEKFERIKMACKILFTGYIRAEESFALSGYEQLDNFIMCLTEGLRHVRRTDGV